MKSKIVLDIKKEQELKYYEVTLQEVTDRKHSFHIECYQPFIALPKSQKKVIKTSQKSFTRHLKKVLFCRADQVFHQKIFKCHQPMFSKRSVSYVHKLLKSIIILN